MEHKVFLYIAGYTILINLHPSELNSHKFYLNFLKKNYTPFLVKLNSERVNFTIHMVDGNISNLKKDIHDKIVYIDFYRILSKNSVEVTYKIGSVLLQVLIREVLTKIIDYKTTVFIHASAVEMNGKGIIFMGPSGAGKSTAVKLLKSDYTVISDDTLILKREKSHYYLYQFPFTEKQKWIKKSAKPWLLSGVYFLHKSKLFRIKNSMTKEHSMSMIVNQVLFSELNSEVMSNLMTLIYQNNFFYNLYFGLSKRKLQGIFREFIGV